MGNDNIYLFKCPKCDTESQGFIINRFQREKCLNCGCSFSRLKNKFCKIK